MSIYIYIYIYMSMYIAVPSPNKKVVPFPPPKKHVICHLPTTRKNNFPLSTEAWPVARSAAACENRQSCATSVSKLRVLRPFATSAEAFSY